jgi:NADPH-dependent curcumin reductase CurA
MAVGELAQEDPQRGARVDLAEDAAYREPVAIAAVMEAGAVRRVTSTQHPGFAVGDHVYGAFGVQDFACSDGTGVTKLDPLLAPLPTYLGCSPCPAATMLGSWASPAVESDAGPARKIGSDSGRQAPRAISRASMTG